MSALWFLWNMEKLSMDHLAVFHGSSVGFFMREEYFPVRTPVIIGYFPSDMTGVGADDEVHLPYFEVNCYGKVCLG